MSLSIEVTGLEHEGVTLVSPEAPDFDDRVRSMLVRIADRALGLKPFVVILLNGSPRTVVSFSIIFRVTLRNGFTSHFKGHRSVPEAICGDTLIGHGPGAVRPGEAQVYANGVELYGFTSSDYDYVLDQFVAEKNQTLANATGLRIELDAVIFDDGRLIGPDEDGWLRDLFSSYVDEKQQWYRLVIEALDAGSSVEEAYAPIRAFAEEQKRDRAAGARPRFGDDHRALWRNQAAAEAASWRRRFSDAEIPALLRAAIRLEPFVIHRATS